MSEPKAVFSECESDRQGGVKLLVKNAEGAVFHPRLNLWKME
jgi:hypothetical protein